MTKQNNFAFTNQTFYDKFIIEHLHVPITNALYAKNYKEVWEKVYAYYWNTAFEFPSFRKKFREKLYLAHDLLFNKQAVKKSDLKNIKQREIEGILLLEDVWFDISTAVANSGQYKTRKANSKINPFEDIKLKQEDLIFDDE